MFTIEGIIGAGKSTLCKRLQEAGFVVTQEPIDQWAVGPYDLLSIYYNNPTKYAYLFQCHVLNTLATLTKPPPPGFVTFQERSIDSNALFSKLQHVLGHMDDVEYAAYMAQYHTHRSKCRVRGRIFLDVDVDTAMQRIGDRSRDGEMAVTREYQEQLRDMHIHWQQQERDNGRPFLVIDTTREDVRSDHIVRTIRDWIRPLLP